MPVILEIEPNFLSQIKKINVRGVVEFNTASVVQAAYVRMFLVLDKQANGTAPTKLSGAGQGNLLQYDGVATDIHAFRDLDNVERYTVLKEWHHNILAFQAGTNSFMKSQFLVNKSVTIPIEYDASASDGSLASIRSNNLLLMCGSDQTSGDIKMNGVIRVRYVDN